MMAWTTPKTDFATGDLLLASQMNDIGNNLNESYGTTSHAAVELSSDQALANNTDTAISWDAESLDTDSYWAGANPTRLTVPEDGVYYMIATAQLDFPNSGGNFRIGWRVNGSTTIRSTVTYSSTGIRPLVVAPAIESLSSGDYVEVIAYQFSGNTENIQGASTQAIIRRVR